MSESLIAIAGVNELSLNEMKRFEAKGQRLLLVNSENDYYVVDEMCSHEDFSMFLGCIQNGRIKCSLHGSYFDLKTGEALVDPADEPINTYAAIIKEEQVWFDLGQIN